LAVLLITLTMLLAVGFTITRVPLLKCPVCSGNGVVLLWPKNTQLDDGWACGRCSGIRRITILSSWRNDSELPVGPYRRPVWSHCCRPSITVVDVQVNEDEQGEVEWSD